MARGFTKTSIAQLTGVSRITIITDVKEIKARNRRIVSDNQVNQVVGDALANYERLSQMALKEFNECPKGEATRGGYLNLVGKFVEAGLKLRQQVGLLPKDGKSQDDEFSLTDGVDPSEMTAIELRKAAEAATLELTEQLGISPDKLRDLAQQLDPDTKLIEDKNETSRGDGEI